MATSRGIVCAVIALGMAAWSSAADARRTLIDGAPVAVTACLSAAASPCSTPSLLTVNMAPAMVANFGFGPFDSVYIYDNGLISIGAPISPSADFSSLASIGGNVLTAGYSSSRPLFTNVNMQGPQNALGDDFRDNPVVRITFCMAVNCYDDDSTEQVNIFDLGSGHFALTFNYGSTGGTGDPVFPDDAYAGYSFGSNTKQLSGLELQDVVTTLAPIEYRFVAGAAPGVPEPLTWITLLLGFFGMGQALRFRPKNVVTAAG